MAKPVAITKDTLEEYRAAVAAKPNSVEAQTNLGWGLYGKGQYEEAIKQFEKAVAMNAQHLDANYGLGLACKKAGSKAQAISAFEKTVNLLAIAEDQARAQLMKRIIQSHLSDLRK